MNDSGIINTLLDRGLVEKQEASLLLKKFNGKVFDIVNHLYTTEEIPQDKILIGRLYGDLFDKAYINLRKILFDKEVLNTVPYEFALEHHCVAIKLLDDVLTVVMPDPKNDWLLKQLSEITGYSIHTEFSFPEDIDDFIEINYSTRSDIRSLSKQFVKVTPRQEDPDSKQLERLAGKKEVVDLVDGLLKFCLKYNASDIHIQPTTRGVNVRYRIDGLLETMLELNKTLNGPVISRLKVMADLDLTERRIPQDGRVSLPLPGRDRDFRISIVPTIMGEKAVLRATGYSTEKTFPALTSLGFSENNLALIESLIKSPNGVLFVTGPTGSGKTTTLYSILSRLNSPEINIVTVEDPVEYRIEGVTQIQVQDQIDLDFSRILRSALRQDPQVILIGEIRDLETAKIASQAALTGHLVMATMHTNNAIQAVTRLVEIGVEPFLVAPSVIGVVGQRLVRKICEHCKESYNPSRESLDTIPDTLVEDDINFYQGKGCSSCRNTGYHGRLPIHEVFLINDHLRQLISDNVSILKIQKESSKHGYVPMRNDGIMKVIQGLTTLEEVDRVTQKLDF